MLAHECCIEARPTVVEEIIHGNRQVEEESIQGRGNLLDPPVYELCDETMLVSLPWGK